jgi:uncharacterized protein (TIGR02996 family)
MAFYPHIQSPRPEVRAFLDDIREHPDDDTPRLILADWLDDHGDEADRARGEFIRLQCLLNRRGVVPREARLQLRQLHHQFASRWLGPLAQLVDGWRFERGLLHLAIQGQRCFTRELHELIHTETFAWVEGLTLRQVTGGFINVAEQLPLLNHIQALTIEESRPGDTALCRLFSLPLENLRELNLAGCQASGEAIRHLATGRTLPRLRLLDLTRNYAASTGITALAQSTCLPHLRELRLGYNLIPDEALTQVADSPLLAQLEWLDLRGNQGCGGAGLSALVQSPGAENLRRLTLTHLPLQADTIGALVRSPALSQLRQLHLDGCAGIGNETLKLLAFSEGLPSLEHLSLARNNLTSEGLVALGQSHSPRRLHMLDISRNYIDHEGAVALATSPVFADLEELDLEANQLSDEGAVALAISPGLGKLHFLDAGSNDLTVLGKAVILRRFSRRVALV